ncbi:LacI family DNA-binding transcriptional regulator [Pseudonocardia sp. WMMC193]|uniref:LacI family DNA-binding transcriptional regulator n=1 Tax=Pseudonocardia sp. WMMC193 TaxID=2911965 RepID=UPI001F450CFE|nr:LacI family DNA-binding transcriptional regulator [Pseudonocardia sp. WMMC193]MCF7548609.1 LacI family transcriptional regulator [Pseudonocardia sp. WMMC193]
MTRGLAGPRGDSGVAGKDGPRRRTPRSGRVTIDQVAAAAGVSIATVSRAIAGRPVRQDLAERALAAARELGYQPNRAAQAIASGAYQTIGVVVPDLENPYFGGVLKRITLSAAGNGYRTVVADANDVPDQELALCRGLLQQSDGLVVVSPRMSDTDLRTLSEVAPNTVLVNRQTPGIALAAVSVDAFGAMLTMCGHLLELGHREVVYLAGPPAAWQERERWRALRQAAAFGLVAHTVPAGSAIADGHRVAEQALATGATALLGFNDLVAIGALHRLTELGVDVPGRVSVTGADDIPFAECVRPGLTTTAAPRAELADATWASLQAAMHGEPPAAAELPEPVLVVRGSTGPARG